MEKTLKRNIGYKKPKETTSVVKTIKPKPVATTLVVPEPPPSTAKDITAWINSHPLVAWGRMCVRLGIDKSNFKRTLESENPYINPEVIIKIEDALKNYGYKPGINP